MSKEQPEDIYDHITCYGECDGIHSYTSIFGASITIPALKMKYYDLQVP